jgi:SAM-dependent methyltransferase
MRTLRNAAEGWQLSASTAEGYERLLVPAIFAPFAERLLELADPRSGARVLDVACGTGIVARRARAYVGSSGTIVGVDCNRDMLDVAEATSGEGEPTIQWLEADVADLPLPDGSTDCVLCQQGLQFFPDREQAVREMLRVLAPGGRLAAGVWRPIDASPGFALLAGALERHAGPEAAAIMGRPFEGPDREGLRALVADAGLRALSVRILIEEVRFPSAEEILLQEVAAGPLAEPWASLSADARAALVSDLTEVMGVHADDNGIVFPMETHVITAER